MKLFNLLLGLPDYKIYGKRNIEITHISEDSRKVKNGSLFVAIKGLNFDGHKFISQAIQNGARVIVGEKKKPGLKIPKEVVYLQVANGRRALGLLAANFYGNPARKLKVIGVTGTDGKTTTANLIYAVLAKAGYKVGLVSTVGARIGTREIDTGLHVTSPDPVSLQALLAEMVREKCEFAVLEVTSHGLDQERVAGVEFDCAVLTNITPEHLDYHKDINSYREAKSKLFRSVKTAAVINKDDSSFGFISSVIPKGIQVISYGINDRTAAIYAQNIHESDSGTSFEVVEGVSGFTLQTRLLGEYNVANILAACGCAKVYKANETMVKKAVFLFEAPKGRLEKIEAGQNYEIYVDFAHTPNSLKSVLTLLKNRLVEKGSGRLIAIFGCAGERDFAKRPLMGEISGKTADISVLTAEDPRTEKVEEILHDMAAGTLKGGAKEFNFMSEHDFPENTNWFVRIPERAEAIAFVLKKVAQRGDCVVICGKGHEKSMAHEGVEHPWSDQDCVKNTLSLKDNLAAIVFSAGKGTRMGLETPKVLLKIGGKPMISYTLQNLRKALFAKVVLVVGYKKDEVIGYFGPGVDYATQPEQLGTGDALNCGIKLLVPEYKDVVAINGDDSAFYNPGIIREMLAFHKNNKNMITFVSAYLTDPFGIGRVVREKNGKVLRIVEEKDANESEKKIKEANIGLYAFNLAWLKKNIKKIKKSSVGEYYVVDLVKIAIDDKAKVGVFKLPDNNQWFGINTQEHLKRADERMRKKLEKAFY